MSNNDTHVVTTPNKRPPMPIEVLRNNLEGEFMNTAIAHFQGNKEMALSFKTACIDYVRKTPKLLDCDRVSLMSAFVNAAQFRFMPSGVSGECYILPYGSEAKFQLGYQGLVTLLYRSDKVLGLQANIVYQNDIFEYEEGLNVKLVHKPAKFGTPRGEWIGVYSVAQLSGGAKTFMVMSKEDVMKIREMSKAKNSASSPWNNNDPNLWMPKKTCLIQHSKLLPKTQELQQAIEKDYEGEVAERPLFDAGGAATAKASHAPVIHDMPSNPSAEEMPPDMGPDININ